MSLKRFVVSVVVCLIGLRYAFALGVLGHFLAQGAVEGLCLAAMYVVGATDE